MQGVAVAPAISVSHILLNWCSWVAQCGDPNSLSDFSKNEICPHRVSCGLWGGSLRDDLSLAGRLIAPKQLQRSSFNARGFDVKWLVAWARSDRYPSCKLLIIDRRLLSAGRRLPSATGKTRNYPTGQTDVHSHPERGKTAWEIFAERFS